MQLDTQSFVVATDAVIASMIAQASRRLVLMAPALSTVVADAAAEAIERLGPGQVTLILDESPAVYRLGYGALEALTQLHAAATRTGLAVRSQPGLRLGLVIADDVTLVYAPTAELVETHPDAGAGLNAIRIGSPPPAAVAALTEATGHEVVGRDVFSPAGLAVVTEDLTDSPPQPFDLSRRVIAFHAFIEFVELEVQGTEVSRRTVSLPSHLLAVADKHTREQLRTTFRLVPPDHKLSGERIGRDRKLLTQHLLRTIPKFGTVVLRQDKQQLLDAVERLKASVASFAQRVREDLAREIDRNISDLSRALLPALVKKPPAEWITSDGQRPGRDGVQSRLNYELREAFGTAEQLVGAMKVSCRFKGVTYDLLNDRDFIEAALKAVPELGDRLHSEVVAAPTLERT